MCTLTPTTMSITSHEAQRSRGLKSYGVLKINLLFAFKNSFKMAKVMHNCITSGSKFCIFEQFFRTQFLYRLKFGKNILKFGKREVPSLFLIFPARTPLARQFSLVAFIPQIWN